MANQWFKFYGGEFLSDTKIAALSAQERICWVTLLCLSSVSSEPGVVEYLTIETLLEKSGIHFNPYDSTEWDNCLAVLEKFSRMKMIDKSDEGRITVLNWEKRQEHNLTNAERAAKSRLKKRNVTTNVTSVIPEENRIEENILVAKATGKLTNKKKDMRNYRENQHQEEDETVIDIDSGDIVEVVKETKVPKGDPAHKVVFDLFGPQCYMMLHVRKQENDAAKFLFKEIKMEFLEPAVRFAQSNAIDPYCPTVMSPYDLRMKWAKLVDYKKKHGG